jgi:diguanylate cyclase (GGDEF)-like protein/PAS domain S-box-containing protein
LTRNSGITDDRYRCVVEYAADGFLLYDGSGQVLDVNQAACDTYGYSREELLGLSIADLLHEDAQASDLLDVDERLCADAPHRLKLLQRCKGGDSFPADVRIGRMDSEDGAPRLFALVRDVSDRALTERRIAQLSDQDGLTGLPNLGRFVTHLESAIEEARRHGRAVSVLHVDINRFRLINQGVGHAAGDELLRQTAWRLREVGRPMDLVARYSADEFLVLLPDLERSVDSSSSDAVAVVEETAARIHAALEPPFDVDGTELYIDATVGMSLFPLDADDGPLLLRHADTACHQAKQPGQGPSKRYAGETSDKWARLWLGTRLRKAVEREQLVLHYQPIVDVRSAWEARSRRPLAPHLAGVEALVRWSDEERLHAPASFIPLAEDLGLIDPIGRWVIDEACRQAGAFRDAGRPLEVSFNLSLRELWRPGLVEEIMGCVASASVDPGALIVEVTESSAMTDPVRTQGVLRSLCEQGLLLAIDDFGVGHSSLARLSELPAQLLKIDRSFVARLPGDPKAVAMVTAMIELARSLGMEALAEGIENEDQLRFLAERNCPLGQGFLFSPPVTPEELLAL